MKKYLLSSLALLLFCSIVKAQITYGPQLGYFYYFKAQKNPSLGAKGEYNVNKRLNFTLDANYLLKGSFTAYDSIRPIDAGDIQKIDVTCTLWGFNSSAGIKTYVYKKYDDVANVYTSLGVGLSRFKFTEVAATNYDPTAYYAPLTGVREKPGITSVYLRAGVGGDVCLRRQIGYAELQFMLPVNNGVDKEGNIKIPMAVNLTIGYRFGDNPHLANYRRQKNAKPAKKRTWAW